MAFFCINCGIELKETYSFCPNCGSKVTLSDNVNSHNNRSTSTSKLNIVIQGFGYIVNFFLLNEGDAKNFKLAFYEKEDFDPYLFMGNFEEEIYETLKDTDYEISSDFDSGYHSSIFEAGFHEIELSDAENDNNRKVIESDVYGESSYSEVISLYSEYLNDYIKEVNKTKDYKYIVLNMTVGFISDFVENETLGNRIVIQDIDEDDIELSKPREIIIGGNSITSLGENWDLINGKDNITLVMNIDQFLNLPLNKEFDYIEFELTK
jgi:hypothetical protein